MAKNWHFEPEKKNAQFFAILDKKTIKKKPPPSLPHVSRSQKMSTIYFAPTPKYY